MEIIELINEAKIIIKDGKIAIPSLRDKLLEHNYNIDSNDLRDF